MVNTFLPYASLEATTRALDFRRLGKQRVEAWQIWNVLTKAESVHPPPVGLGAAPWATKRAWMEAAAQRWKAATGKRLGWATHPAVVLWVGHRDGLAVYYNAMLKGWEARGGHNNVLKPIPVPPETPLPPWTQSPVVHNAFRWQLLRKELWQPVRGIREPSWYVKQPDFIGATPVPDYVWEP